MFKGGPPDWWSISALEGSLSTSVFWGQVLFSKGAIYCALAIGFSRSYVHKIEV